EFGERILVHVDFIGVRILPYRLQRFSLVVRATVNSSVTGMGLIAIGEGVVLGLAYWIAGVPSPALLGAVTGFMALIPGGAPLSFTLVSIYLLSSGKIMEGVGYFLGGALGLFTLDKTRGR